MPTIYLDRAFLATVILSAHELYRYHADPDDPNSQETSAECLGSCWGNYNPADETFMVVYASVTQLVEERDDSHVVGPNPMAHAVHAAWAGLDLGDLNRIGSFHSHPWSHDELATDGLADDDRWTASPSDQRSMAIGDIEVIVSVRPRSSVPHEQHVWAHRGLLVSGRHDENHVTVSGWYKRTDDQVEQVRLCVPDVARINRGIERIDAR